MNDDDDDDDRVSAARIVGRKVKICSLRGVMAGAIIGAYRAVPSEATLSRLRYTTCMCGAHTSASLFSKPNPTPEGRLGRRTLRCYLSSSYMESAS